MATKISDDDFIAAWRRLQSVTDVANEIGLSVRAVNVRRRKLEKKHGVILNAASPRSPDFKIYIPENGVRVNVELDSGTIMVASDCHYWPGIVSTAHRAFVLFAETLKPKIIVINGDAFDGASISRHPPGGTWEAIPSVKQELEACQERLSEIEAASLNSKLHFLWGNHDQRFNARLAAQVGDGFKGIVGMNLTDHFPRWKFSMSLMVNGNCMIKHRWHNGIHAIYNNTLKAGTSIITGHLHSLKCTPFTDYNGTRYGVDTGSLADVNGQQFSYQEDNARNHRSGFAVLTFYKGKLLPPELCEVLDEDEGTIYFRGNVFKV
jgi:calcineurin-like phosphoesterase family protein